MSTKIHKHLPMSVWHLTTSYDHLDLHYSISSRTQCCPRLQNRNVCFCM